MSICMAMHFGDYALLCADTRTTWCQQGQLPIYDDDSEKIRQTGIGLITGAGWVPLLDRVKDGFENVSTAADLRRIVVEAQTQMRGSFNGEAPSEVIEARISKTGWFFTYTAVVDETPVVRLGLIHPEVDEQVGGCDTAVLVGRDELRIIAPFEATRIEAEVFLTVFRGELRPLSAFAAIDDHFAYHRGLCVLAVSEAADRWQSVSKFLHVGVHTRTGQIEIAPRIAVPVEEQG